MTFLILLLAALLGGAFNALAGGGTFMVFPALLLTGMASVKANATASLVLLPGAFASGWVYRDIIARHSNILGQLALASLIGSLGGSLLLLHTSNATFSSTVPWLLLSAALVFTLAPRIRKLAQQAGHHESMPVLLIGQVVISFYGGYFGAGMGVLMITLYLVVTRLDVHAASGVRVLCGVTINALAVAIFAWRGALDYNVGIPMLIAAIIGGYFGALLVKRLNANHARNAILIYAWALTAWFFGRMLLH
jgi:uncharacterized membrane protein YfcA